jgi:transcriptional regulator of heat shock response
MSKKEKLEARIRNNPRNVSLEDFESLVYQYGEIKEGDNHPLAIVGKRVFPYRRTNPVLTPYVVKVLELIEALNK